VFLLKTVLRSAVLVMLFFLFCGEDSHAASEAMQFGSDRTVMKRKENRVELRGNAYVFRENEVIRADAIDLDQKNQTVRASGRVTYQFDEYSVRADAIEMDLTTHVGQILNGSLSNGRFSLRGSKFLTEGLSHFKISDYDYSTCLDCPNSWELTGREVDFTIEGYAFIHDFIFKVKDASVMWLPFMVLPAKTRRQSGLLFPKFGVNQVYGAFIVQPYYWAINDWSDMTFGAGVYASRGSRFEWEGRYVLTPESRGNFNLFFTKDNAVEGLKYRYALKTEIAQEMPFGFSAKLRLNEVSDSGYPVTYADDVPGRLEPVLTSDLFFSRNEPAVSTVLSFKRIRNLLRFDANNRFVGGFDPATVQESPRIVINSNDQFVFGQSFAAGIEARFNRFSREAGPFDRFTFGTTQVETIREANRFTLIPNLYTTLNPKPWLSLTPSVQYRSFFYNFNGIYQNLARGYLLAQADLSLQLEKVFRGSEPGVSYKHTIRPTLTYANIPTIQQSSNHPFIDQIQSQARPGQYFDNSDIVPERTTQNLNSYFTPLGNSLTYGLVTQVFRKETGKDGAPDRVARRFEAGLTQTLDIKEANRFLTNRDDDDRVLLSPLFTHLMYSGERFNARLEYTYYSFLDRYRDAQLLPFANPHRLSSTFSWVFDRALKDGLLRFERSLSVNYTFSKLTAKVSSLQTSAQFSLNDYVMPRASLSYNLVTGNFALLDSAFGVLFQSPSRCWQLDLGVINSIDRGTGPVINFSMNISGNSFGSLDQTL
jgi:lipopolysaccharide assembly outer membrane protein LptD (OstA)